MSQRTSDQKARRLHFFGASSLALNLHTAAAFLSRLLSHLLDARAHLMGAQLAQRRIISTSLVATSIFPFHVCVCFREERNCPSNEFWLSALVQLLIFVGTRREVGGTKHEKKVQARRAVERGRKARRVRQEEVIWLLAFLILLAMCICYSSSDIRADIPSLKIDLFVVGRSRMCAFEHQKSCLMEGWEDSIQGRYGCN